MLMDAIYSRNAGSPNQMTRTLVDGGGKSSSPLAGTFVETANQFDVMMGRGIGPNEHPGNKRYRTIVHSFQSDYLATKKRKEKERIARKAIRAVKANGARFLKLVDATPVAPFDDEEGQKPKNKSNKQWIVAENETVLEKTKQALRFVGHYHHSSTKKTVDGERRGEDSSSDGGGGGGGGPTSSSKLLSRQMVESKGPGHAVGSISRVGAPMGREAYQPGSPPTASAVLSDGAGGAATLSAALVAQRFSPLDSLQGISSTLLHQQQLNQEMAHQEELRRAFAAGLSRRDHHVSDDLATRIAFLLEPSRRSQQQEASDTTGLLLQRLLLSSQDASYGHPLPQTLLPSSSLDRLFWGLNPNASALGGLGSTPSSLAPSSLWTSNRSVDSASILRSLRLPTEDGFLSTSGESQRSDESPAARLSSSLQEMQTIDSTVLLSLLLQRQQQQQQQQQHTINANAFTGRNHTLDDAT